VVEVQLRLQQACVRHPQACGRRPLVAGECRPALPAAPLGILAREEPCHHMAARQPCRTVAMIAMVARRRHHTLAQQRSHMAAQQCSNREVPSHPRCRGRALPNSTQSLLAWPSEPEMTNRIILQMHMPVVRIRTAGTLSLTDARHVYCSHLGAAQTSASADDVHHIRRFGNPGRRYSYFAHELHLG